MRKILEVKQGKPGQFKAKAYGLKHLQISELKRLSNFLDTLKDGINENISKLQAGNLGNSAGSEGDGYTPPHGDLSKSPSE